jgi:hypothetical protein
VNSDTDMRVMAATQWVQLRKHFQITISAYLHGNA